MTRVRLYIFAVLFLLTASIASTALAQFVPFLLGTRSAPQSGPPPPSGIACAYGQTYPGTVPASAQEAGLNTCMLYSDFNDPTYATQSNWLGACGGPSSPNYRWVAAGPCSRYSQVFDSSIGKNVLQLEVRPGDGPVHFSWPDTVYQNRGTNIIPIPLEMYIEVTYRIPVGLTTQNSQYILFGGELASPTGINPPIFLEPDLFETIANSNPVGNYGDGTGEWCGSGGEGQNCAPQPGGIYSPGIFRDCLDNPCQGAGSTTLATQYVKVGILFTSDGTANYAKCYDQNGTRQGCGTLALHTPSILTNADSRQYVFTFLHDGSKISATWDAYIESIALFGCVNWKTTNCYNGIVNS